MLDSTSAMLEVTSRSVGVVSCALSRLLVTELGLVAAYS